MILKSLTLYNFKNYKQEHTLFQTGYNVITGLNGAGKTNLLDAIYYLSLTKSFFQFQDQVLLYEKESFFRLEAIVEKDGNDIELVCKVEPGQRKEFLINDRNYEKLSEHIGRFPLVMVTPDDIAVVKEYSDGRRKLIDTVLCQTDPAYLYYLSAYQKALTHRNAYIKSLNHNAKVDRILLQTYNDQLAFSGQIIFEKRQLFTQALAPIFQRVYGALATARESANLYYDSQLFHKPLSELLDYNELADIAGRRTSVGIHRDDWDFMLNGNPVKRTGSQGQQKSFLLALKLGLHQYMKDVLHITPFLLLDDIFDKLDTERTAKLMQVVKEIGFVQIFITDTGARDISKVFGEDYKKIHHIYVENGKISPS